MGFFDRKVICGVCGREVGLNRYKVKKSNAWVCPDCISEAGGISVINVSKVTIEDIKAILNEKRERLGDDPMSTAEGMYQYCKENNFGKGFTDKWALKHFKILQDNLMKDEKVLMTFIGLHNYKSTTKHDNNYAYAVTNKRIIFGQKSITGEKFKSVSFEKINDITFEKGLVFGVLTLDTPQEKFNVALDAGSASSINSHIHEVIDSIKSIPHTYQEQISSVSSADELKKYKELLDMGVITEEEFSAKKKQLLNL